MSVRSILLVGIALVVVLCEGRAMAHRLDEYLQATLVTIETNTIRLEISLTPGTSVATQLLARIDTDGNGQISANEAQSYAQVLKKSLTTRLDERDTPLRLSRINIPEVDELVSGDVVIQIIFSNHLPSLTRGTHTLAFTNHHEAAIGAYLLNATRPMSTAVQIQKQNRNSSQSGGEIIFTYNPPRSENTTVGLLICAGAFLGGIGVSFWSARRQNLT
jgi:hypothetical protein